MKIVPSDIQNV